MPKVAKSIWLGAKVVAKVKRAQVKGMNATMTECVWHAKNLHPWRNRTTTLEGSLRIIDYAAVTSTGVAGLWGSADVNYAVHLELGFGGRYKYLRPAADEFYPNLINNIREAYTRGV